MGLRRRLKRLLRAVPRWVRGPSGLELYRRSILASPPVVCGEDGDVEIHLLTCRRDLLDALWSLKTYFHVSETRPALAVHDDGSLEARDHETLLRHFPGCRVIRRADADALLAGLLAGRPHCLRFRQRKDFYCALKLFDAFQHARADKLLLLDSDLLFFRRPDELLGHLAAGRPFFLRDYQDAYALPRAELEATFGGTVAPRVNAGLMSLRARHYAESLDLLEGYLARRPSHEPGDVNRHEQTLHALLLSRYGAQPLGDGYQISNQVPITEATVAHHSVSDGSRAQMQAAGLSRLQASGFLEALAAGCDARSRRPAPQPPIVIVVACDQGFAPPMTVMLRSLLANASGPGRFVVYVLSDGLGPEVRATILGSLGDPRVELRFVELDARPLAGLKVSHHVSQAVYFRLLLPNVVPESVDRVIYLDCDLIVNADIRALWESDLGGKTLLAVQEQDSESQVVSGPAGLPSYKDLGLPPDAKYFNSGVMLIDLQRWRATDVSGRALAYLRAYRDKVLWWDQDALNAVLAGDWGELDHRWNLLSQSFTHPRWDDGPVKDRATYDELLRRPFILHFNTPEKPWDERNEHPRRDLFLHYLGLTRWAGRWPPKRRWFSRRVTPAEGR